MRPPYTSPMMTLLTTAVVLDQRASVNHMMLIASHMLELMAHTSTLDYRELQETRVDIHTSPDSVTVVLVDMTTSLVEMPLALPTDLKSAQIRTSLPEAFLIEKKTTTFIKCSDSTLHPMLVSNSDLDNDCRL